MGRPKLLLPWGNSTVIGHLLVQWRSLGAEQIGVVCAEGDRDLRLELERSHLPSQDWIFNPVPEQGMFSSIQCAARWLGWQAGLSHWVIVLGDQPHLRAETLRHLLRFAAANPECVCQPTRTQRPRHPVVLPKSVFVQLASSSASVLKTFLSNYSVAYCELDDPGLDLDIDTPEDYSAARGLA